MYRWLKFILGAMVLTFTITCGQSIFSKAEKKQLETSLNQYLQSQQGLISLKEIHTIARENSSSGQIGDKTRSILYQIELETKLRNRIIHYMNEITTKENSKKLPQELQNSRSIIRILSDTINGHLVRNGYQKVYQ